MSVRTTSILPVFPMDSAKPTEWVDGLPVYDRGYNAVDLRQFFSLLVTDGVYTDYLDEMLPYADENGTWYVSPGAACANGLLIHLEEPQAVIDQSDIATGQYAYIIVSGRFDSAYRDGSVTAVLTSLATYEPVRTDSEWQLVLGRVDWRGELTDYRLVNGMCGPVQFLAQVDTSSFVATLVTAASQFKLFVGEVATLPSGSEAYVRVNRPDEAGQIVTIDYGIPRGAPGYDGKDGTTLHGIYVQADEPPAEDGTVWFVDDPSTTPHTVTSIRVYSGIALYPAEDVWSGEDTWPGGGGEWVEHVLSASVAPGDGSGGSGGDTGGTTTATTVSAGAGAPTDSTPHGVYIDTETGDLYQWEG